MTMKGRMIMRRSRSILAATLVLFVVGSCVRTGSVKPAAGGNTGPASLSAITGPLRHTPNSRYFVDGSGKAIALTGSHHWNNLQDGHYVLDYNTYLDFMVQHNHNFMRMWTWESVEMTPTRYRRTGPGTAIDGGLKFDASPNGLNQAYFDLLRSRVSAARDRGIYVSIVLFQGWDIEDHGEGDPWPRHPFNAANNINGINGDPNGDNQGHEVHTLSIKAITNLQDAYVRKVIDTVNDLDNVLFEISNESNTDSVSWQYHMINLIKNYEARKPKRHPVGMTSLGYCAIYGLWREAIPNTALYNSPADWISPFGGRDYEGYATNPPAAKGSKVMIPDTDHGAAGGDAIGVWKNVTRGLNPILMDTDLSYSIPPPSPDASEPARQAMGRAVYFINTRIADLNSMTPQNGGSSPASTGYCLYRTGAEYLVYLPGAGNVNMSLPAGNYNYAWYTADGDPLNVSPVASGSVTGGSQSFSQPSGANVLYITANSKAGLLPGRRQVECLQHPRPREGW